MPDRFREQGAFSWFELRTSDVGAAESFYSRVFGWKTEPWTGEGDYTLVKVGENEVGGMVAPRSDQADQGAQWGIHITVTDVDETARKVEECGGKLVVPPTDIPRVGRYCVFEDPQGARISAITYRRG